MHKTKNLNDGYMGSGKALKNSIKKYGITNFTKEILFIFDNEQEMLDKEKELVTICEQSYNLCEGGKGGFSYINRMGLGGTLGFKHSQETCEKHRKNMFKKLKQRTDDDWIIIKKQISEGLKKCFGEKREGTFKNKNHTEESKRKIGIANSIHQKGEKNNQFGTMWITNGIDNKKIKKDLDNIPDGWYKGRK